MAVPGAGQFGILIYGDSQFPVAQYAVTNYGLAAPTAGMGDCPAGYPPEVSTGGSTCTHLLWLQDYQYAVANPTRNVQLILNVGDVTDTDTPQEVLAALEGFNYMACNSGAATCANGTLPVLTEMGNHDEWVTTCGVSYLAGMKAFYEGTAFSSSGFTSGTSGAKPYVYDYFGSNDGRWVGGGCASTVTEVVHGSYANIAYSVTLQGQQLLVLSLQVNPTAADVTWAKAVEARWLASYPTGRIWADTHDFLSTCVAGLSTCTTVAAGGATCPGASCTDIISTAGQVMWTGWLDTDTHVELVLCGHVNTPSSTSQYLLTPKSQTNLSGHLVMFMDLDDQQTNDNAFGLATVTKATGRMDLCLYSPFNSNYVSSNGAPGVASDKCASINLAVWPAGSSVVIKSGVVATGIR